MKNFSSIVIAMFLTCLSMMFAGEVFSFQSTFVPVEDSRLWIEGRSNVNEFECTVENYSGEASLPEFESPTTLLTRASDLLFVQIDVEVDSIDCGQRKMNNDLRKALKADSFPEITFVFEEANVISEPQSLDDAFEVEVHGLLTIAGSTREISFLTEAYYQNEHRVRAVGQTTIKMTDYGVEPPSALMGLIRANEELTVNFDLIATPRNQ